MTELCFPKSRKGALMDFVRYADSVRAKLHMGGARLPVVIGITAVAICVLVAGGVGLASVVAPDSAFTVEKADASDGESGQADPVQSKNASLLVHVGGSVADPGLYELAGDARVQQAIDAAGGFAETLPSMRSTLPVRYRMGNRSSFPVCNKLLTPGRLFRRIPVRLRCHRVVLSHMGRSTSTRQRSISCSSSTEWAQH